MLNFKISLTWSLTKCRHYMKPCESVELPDVEKQLKVKNLFQELPFPWGKVINT